MVIETVGQKSVRVIIDGQVQGVFFRKSAKDLADKLGLVGWIRNDDDGSVEALVVGSKDSLGKFLDWCKNGPPLAKVEKVEVDWTNTDQEFETFDIV